MTVKDWVGQFETTRTTITLPTRLIERTQAAVDRGLVPNRSVAVTTALESFLDELERREIDSAFAAMRDDEGYRELSQAIDRTFAESDWEAFVAVETTQ